jgi:hypothetical protein
MRWTFVLMAGAIGSLAAADFAEARKGGFVSSLIHGGVRTGAAPAGSGSASSYSPKTYGSDTLTPAQLERCVSTAVTLDKSAEQTEETFRKVDAEKAAIEAAQARLSADQARVDRRSRAQVDAFNRKLEALNERINRHNAVIRSYKSVEATHNQKVPSYNGECAKKYYAEDMAAVKTKLNLQE